MKLSVVGLSGQRPIQADGDQGVGGTVLATMKCGSAGMTGMPGMARMTMTGMPGIHSMGSHHHHHRHLTGSDAIHSPWQD